MGGVAKPGVDVGAISAMQEQSFKQQLDLMSVQQKKADQDALVNAQSSEIKAHRDSTNTLGRNLA